MSPRRPSWRPTGVGNSPPNVVSPLMPYFALVVIFAQCYDKNAGVGTMIAMMLPYGVAVSIIWILLFLVWELLGSVRARVTGDPVFRPL